MEPCYILFIYILITQPTINITRKILKKLPNILDRQKFQEVCAILQDNQILRDSKASYLEKYACINRHNERLKLYLVNSIFEEPLMPTLKELAREKIKAIQKNANRWLSISSTYQPLISKLDQLGYSVCEQLGLTEDKDVLFNAHVNWIHMPACFDNVALLLQVVLDALEQNSLSYTGANNVTVLHIAALLGNTEIVTQFLASKAIDTINSVDVYGNMPLHYALEGNQKENAWLFLRAGAAFNVPNYLGILPLHLAAYYGQTPFVQYLLDQRENVDALGDNNFDINLLNLKNTLIKSDTQQNFNYQHLAAFTKFRDSLRSSILVVSDRIDPKGSGYMLYVTPLCWAILNEALFERQQEVIALLLEQGADIFYLGKCYKINNEIRPCPRGRYLGSIFNHRSPKLRAFLEQTLLKREVKSLIQCIESTVITITAEHELFKRFKNYFLKKPDIDQVLTSIALEQSITPETLQNVQALLTELYLQPLSPADLALDPQVMRHFLHEQWQIIQQDIKSLQEANLPLVTRLLNSDQLKEWINTLSLDNLLTHYLYYKRQYLLNHMDNLRKYRHKLLNFILFSLLFGVLLGIGQAKFDIFPENTSIAIRILIPLFFFVIAPVWAGSQEVRCVNAFNKLQIELHELDKNYPVFEANNPLISAIKQELPEVVIDISQQENLLQEAPIINYPNLANKVKAVEQKTSAYFGLWSLPYTERVANIEEGKTKPEELNTFGHKFKLI